MLASYYLTIDLPDLAGELLQRVGLIQQPAREDIAFNLKCLRAETETE